MIHDNTILYSCNLCYHSVSVNIPHKKLTRLDDQKSWNIIISLRTLDASQRYYTITLKNIIVHVVFNWQKHPPLATTLREEPTFCTAHASFDKHRSLKAGEDPSDTKIILMSSDVKLWKSIWKSKVKSLHQRQCITYFSYFLKMYSKLHSKSCYYLYLYQMNKKFPHPNKIGSEINNSLRK